MNNKNTPNGVFCGTPFDFIENLELALLHREQSEKVELSVEELRVILNAVLRLKRKIDCVERKV